MERPVAGGRCSRPSRWLTSEVYYETFRLRERQLRELHWKVRLSAKPIARWHEFEKQRK